jgi:hypothetical protein
MFFWAFMNNMTWFSIIQTKIVCKSTLFFLFHEGLNIVLSNCMGLSFSEVVEGWVDILGGKFLCVVGGGS